jgi:Domain of unknown function (DUF4411)
VPNVTAKYSIDTSSLIAGWAERYPPRHFAPFWASMEQAITSGLILISREVIGDIKRKDDDLHKWLKGLPFKSVEIDDPVQAHVTNIMAQYPKLVDTRTGKSGSDPFVIALAMANDPKLTVVTEENRGGSINKPRIPFVCDQLDVSVLCINLLGLIKAEDWRF